MSSTFIRPAVGEFLGVAGLSMAVMGGAQFSARLGSTPAASVVGVLAIAAAIAAILAAIGPLTGGHINPTITLSLLVTGAITKGRCAFYVAAQVAGALVGAVVANGLWSVELVALGSGSVDWKTYLVEATATFGLIAVIHGCVRGDNASRLWLVVPAYVLAVGFAAPFWIVNPALVVSVAVSGGGWSAAGAAGLIATELVVAVAAAIVVGWLYGPAPAEVAEEVEPTPAQGTAIFEVAFDVPQPQREAVAEMVQRVAERIHRPIDFIVRDRTGRLLLAVDADEEQVWVSLERRLNEHATLALIAAGLPVATITLRLLDREALTAGVAG